MKEKLTFGEFVSIMREIQPLYAEYENKRRTPGCLAGLYYDQDYSKKFLEARKSYLRGSGKDPIEFEMRKRALWKMFWPFPDQFRFYSIEELEESIAKTKNYIDTVKKESVAEELAERKEKRLLAEKGEAPKETKEIQPLTISERAVSYIFGQQKLGGSYTLYTRGRKLNHRLMWASDILSVLVTNECGFSDNRRREKDLALFENASEFNWLIKNYDSIKSEAIKVNFKASKARDMLGFNSDRMSIKDVKELFQQLQEVIFDLERGPVFYDIEKGGWAPVKSTVGSSLYTLRIDEVGDESEFFSNRWKTKDILITCMFDTVMGWLFVGNLSCGRAGRITLPKGFAPELNPGAQNVLRELRLWRNPRPYSVNEMAALVGSEAKDVADIKRKIDHAINELLEKKYISVPLITGRGWDTKYRLESNV